LRRASRSSAIADLTATLDDHQQRAARGGTLVLGQQK
jgi:hypothetical protein